jgi:hypothetical protein
MEADKQESCPELGYTRFWNTARTDELHAEAPRQKSTVNELIGVRIDAGDARR